MRKKQVATVEEAGTRLTEWRQSRQKGAAIPDELWSAAIEVARRDGVTRTATALHLETGEDVSYLSINFGRYWVWWDGG